MPQLCAAAAPALADGRVRRLAFDTYERELERYGGPDGMALSERLFTADSDAALELIGLTPGDGGADARWRVTLLGIDRLLDDLGLDLGVRRGVLAATRDRLGAELGVGAPFTEAIARRFRAQRDELWSLLEPVETELPHSLAAGVAVYDRRSVALAPIAAGLRAAERAGRLERPLAALAGSYVHMHVNRVLGAAAKAQELVLADFLGRLYAGRMARRRSTVPSRPWS